MMTCTPLAHTVELFFFMMNDGLIACFVEDVEVCVSDKCGKRHDSVIISVQAGHLTGSTKYCIRAQVSLPHSLSRPEGLLRLMP
jgi:hypothetical protein